MNTITQNTKRAMKYFSLLLFLFSFAFASCSKSDDAPSVPKTNATTFTLSIEQPTVQSAKVIARSTTPITPTRYIMEVWSEDGMTEEKVFGTAAEATNHAEITSGTSFTAVLDKTKAYTCLFWADDDTDNAAGVFNAASLKSISLNAGKEMTEAYHGKVVVATGKKAAVAVTLKHAVAKIILTETVGVVTTNNLALTISNVFPTFDVLDAQASGTPALWSKNTNPSVTTGIIGTFYLFAKSNGALSDLKFTYANEAEKTVSNIPLQQNHATNIKGEYSNIFLGTFSISDDQDWTAPENDVIFAEAKVGDFYYANKTFSSIYTNNAQNPCIGIVCLVNADGRTGKIMSLDEETNLVWSTENVTTGATSNTDGAANTAKIFALPTYTAAEYPVFAWCATKNVSKPDGIDWYIPAYNELKDEIFKNKVALNTALTAAGATPFTEAIYASSTEISISTVYGSVLISSQVVAASKGATKSFRALSAF